MKRKKQTKTQEYGEKVEIGEEENKCFNFYFHLLFARKQLFSNFWVSEEKRFD